MVSTDTKTVAVFVALAIALWYASTTVTESTTVQAVILLGIGIVVPTLLNERRRRNDR